LDYGWLETVKIIMLKDLRLPNADNKTRYTDYNSSVACNLVNVLYEHVRRSIQNDRSAVKLNAFTKSMILGVLEKTRVGTSEYVQGMNNEDIRLLLDDIEKELAKRKR
jgi:hypothetical protein